MITSIIVSVIVFIISYSMISSTLSQSSEIATLRLVGGRRVIRRRVCANSSTASREKKLLEDSSEFGVEDGVDGRVEETVHISEPDEKREEDRVNLTDGMVVEKIVTNADGVDYVDREEGNPTEQKHSYEEQQHRSRI